MKLIAIYELHKMTKMVKDLVASKIRELGNKANVTTMAYKTFNS